MKDGRKIEGFLNISHQDSPSLQRPQQKERKQSERWDILVSGVTTKSKMARNCEKKLIGLNRMYIKKQQEG